jgi:TPR repeat protein
MLYELGRGVPQSCKKAAQWVTNAAQYGNAAAEYNLALRYRDGDGVPANPGEADHWFRKAALHKTPTPDHVLAELPEQLPASLHNQ